MTNHMFRILKGSQLGKFCPQAILYCYLKLNSELGLFYQYISSYKFKVTSFQMQTKCSWSFLQITCWGSSFFHHGGQGESKIDHILSLQWQEDLVLKVSSLKDHPTNTSDHTPIVARLPNIVKRLPKDNAAKLASDRYDWDKIDQRKYCQIIHQELNIKNQGYSEKTEVELLLHISNAIKKAASAAVPIRRKKKKGVKYKTWSPTIASLVKVNKQLHWKCKIAATEQERLHLKVKCKEAKINLRREQRQHHAHKRAQQYAKLMQASTEDDQLFFNTIKKHRKVIKTEGSELLVDGARVVNKDEVKEAWADHFERLATPDNNVNFDDDYKKEIDEGMSTIQNFLSSKLAKSSPISQEEVARAVGKLKRKKADDIEGLCAEHIIYGEEILIPHLIAGGGGGKARFNVATPTNATVTRTAYVLPYDLQTKSI